MKKEEFKDYKRAALKKWAADNYIIKKVVLQNLFNWKNATLSFNSPIVLITGRNGSGKSTFINAIKQLYALQSGRSEFGILHGVNEYSITIFDKEDRKIRIENKILKEAEFILPEVFDLTFNFQLYNYYKGSSGADMQKNLAALEAYDAIPLPGQLTNLLREITDKDIASAEKIIDEEEPWKNYFRLKLRDGTMYDSYTMGSGEFYINQFLWGLESLKDNSVILIEELENFLHCDAQKKIVELIHEYSVTKNSQFILTTHSPTVIDHCDESSTILIKNSLSSNVVSIENCANWLAKDILGTNIQNKVHVLAEDARSEEFFRAIIFNKEPKILNQISISSSLLNDSKINTLVKASLDLNTARLIGVIDGDSSIAEGDLLFKLPGNLPPERTILDWARENYDKIADKIGKDLEEIKDIFEKAYLLVDHHEIIEKISHDLSENQFYLWTILTKLWASNNQEIITPFYIKFKDGFNKILSG